MKYMGSKNRIAKDILPIILKDRKPGQWYVEPFVGGANMIDKVDGLRIGADFNPYVIEALKLIRDNPESLPDEVSEEEYAKIKSDRTVNGLTGVIGFGCSFAGTFMGTYARGGGRNYAREAKNNALKQSNSLKNVLFIHSSFQYLDLPPKSIVYCDPPYEGTYDYKIGFSSLTFWDWVRCKTNEGHKVYVSEYSAPQDFISVWSKNILQTVNNNSITDKRSATEKLFVHVSVIDNLD